MTITVVRNPDLRSIYADFEGNRQVGGRFFHRQLEPFHIGTVLRWRFGRNPQRREKRLERYRLPVQRVAAFPEHDYLCWLGHAGFVMRLGGRVLYTDPCYFPLPGIARHAPLPCAPQVLPAADYIMVSHDHRDHFDMRSLRTLAAARLPQMLLPLGAARLLKGQAWQGARMQEAGWYQQYDLPSDGPEVFFLPAKHWGRRGVNDFNKTLWGSFVVRFGQTCVFFAGDSAYSRSMFAQMGDVLAGQGLTPDYCLMPIGAYSPAFMMQRSHMNPEEAWQAFELLGGKTFIPMHYGTYDLSDEPLGEPLRRLQQLADGRLKVVSVGEILNLSPHGGV